MIRLRRALDLGGQTVVVAIRSNTRMRSPTEFLSLGQAPKTVTRKGYPTANHGRAAALNRGWSIGRASWAFDGP
jgi:hypothetical protein